MQDNDPSPSLDSICSCQDAGQSFLVIFYLLNFFFFLLKLNLIQNVYHIKWESQQEGSEDTKLKGELCKSLLFGSMALAQETRSAKVHVTVVRTSSRPPQTGAFFFSSNPVSSKSAQYRLTMLKVSPFLVQGIIITFLIQSETTPHTEVLFPRRDTSVLPAVPRIPCWRP